jgi:hypothetical protein
MAYFWEGDWPAARQLADDICAEPIVGTMAGMEPAFRLLLLAYADDPAVDAAIESLEPRVCVAGRENQVGAWHVGIALLESAAILGRRERCAALYPCAVQLGEAGTRVVWTLGLAEKHAGIAAAAAGRWETAERHFRTAAEQADGMGHVLELAELPRWRAQMLLWRSGAGDLEKARSLLGEARAAYAAIGMGRHLEVVDGLLARAAGRSG